MEKNKKEAKRKVTREESEFCNCGICTSITTGFEDDWGYWDVCVKCGKKLEDGHHYYNHYDGEDHDDIDLW